jgi:hypothetical protein
MQLIPSSATRCGSYKSAALLSLGAELRLTQFDPRSRCAVGTGGLKEYSHMKITVSSRCFSVQVSKDELQILLTLIALLFGLTAK